MNHRGTEDTESLMAGTQRRPGRERYGAGETQRGE